MGDEYIYIDNVRNYYNIRSIILSAIERPSLKACSSFPDGKTQRRERRARAIRRRKGRL